MGTWHGGALEMALACNREKAGWIFPDGGDRTHGHGQCASKGERPDGLAVALNPVRSRLARAATMSIRWFKALPPSQQHGPDEVLLSEVNRQLGNL